MRSSSRKMLPVLVVGLVGLCVPGTAWPQGEAPSPVRFTEVEQRPVQRSVSLTGSVESRTASLVASEVEGLVAEIVAREGDALRVGDPMVRLRATNLELRLRASAGQLKEARARLELSERNLERAQDLLEDGVISQGDYDDAISEFTAWQGRIDALNAEIERIEVDLDRSTIRAPFRGVVVRERTDVGEWVDVGDPVMELVALDRLEVLVEVPERYFPNLQAGAQASVAFESIPGLEVEGRVSAIIPRADAQSRTFPVRIRIPNQGGRIGVGMLARVSMPLGETYQALLVPKDAIVSQGPMRVVYRVNGDDTVETVGVQVGQGIGSWVTVEGELQSGQRVVTRGNERLMPGQKVAGRPLEYDLP